MVTKKKKTTKSSSKKKTLSNSKKVTTKNKLHPVAIGLIIFAVIAVLFAASQTLLGDKQVDEIETGEAKTTLTILNDKTCIECNIDGLTPQIIEIFGDLEIIEIDYSSEEGEKLYEREGISFLPALLFSKEIKDSPAYSEMAMYFVDLGNYLSLQIGADYNPTKPDNFNDCVIEAGITPETVIFYYSDTCPWCTMMKPAVETLESEGYSILSANANTRVEVIESCFREYMGGGVPQFICPKNGEIRPGAFADQSGNVNLDGFRAWVDLCIEG